MAAAEHAPSAGEYIVHHLTHWQNKPMSGVVDFSVVNYDSIIWSVLMGLLGSWLLWRAAKSATSGPPGRFQAAVEFLVEMVDTQARGIVHNATSRKLVAPLALAVFVWIFPDERDGLAAGRSAAVDLGRFPQFGWCRKQPTLICGWCRRPICPPP